MAPPPHTKPENVLKRAQELIGVGQAQAALTLMHEHVTSKRTRNNPITSIEPVMLLFVELCVDLRKGKSAKDGLYSYKNTAQNTNIGTIELVLSKFIQLAEQKVGEAQGKAQEMQTASSASPVDDLEAIETPESILLSTVSGAQSRDRTDRAVVTPWLKFLWETYRTVLDILKNNARLETLYQTTANQAFQFCSKYIRKTEFRRLCELLRNHLQNAAKYQLQIHAINLSDADTLQRHLDTRFQQLEVAVELELWQEAFRSVEDIHTLFNLSKRPAKPLMMANYFDKLAKIFLVGENYLYHAAAYSRYFNLLRGSGLATTGSQISRKDVPVVTDADLTKCASFVLISALAIPVISTSRSRGAMFDADEARKSKNSRLTNLLALSTPPSRASIFKDIQAKGLLKRARSDVQELYNILEVDFHPLSICRKISPILERIGSDEEMSQYVIPLRQVILTRLVQQLSQVYESVELGFVLDLAKFPKPFEVTTSVIEKFVMNGCKKGDLGIRIDHAAGALTFDADVLSSARALHTGPGTNSGYVDTISVQRLQRTPAEIVRSQISQLAKTLSVTCQHVDASFIDQRLNDRRDAILRAEQSSHKEHTDNLQRRNIIDNKKHVAASVAAHKRKEEETKNKLKVQEAELAELKRIEAQNKEREQKRLREQQAKIQKDEALNAFNELLSSGRFKLDPDAINVDELDTQAVRLLRIQQLEKEKQELGERLRVVGKRNDHLERAFRLEEIKHITDDYDGQKERDYAEYERTTAQTLKDAAYKHKDNVSLKNRLGRLVLSYESFKSQVRTERRAQFDKQRRTAERELQQQKEARIAEFRDRRLRERREAEARALAEQAEEQRIHQESLEKAAADEERKVRAAEERARREEDRRLLDDKAALQRQREAEAEAKVAVKKTERKEWSSSATDRSLASETPRMSMPKVAGGWREREAARAAGQASLPTIGSSPASTSAGGLDSSATVTKSGYIPPHLRRNQAGTVVDGTRDATSQWARASEERMGPRFPLQDVPSHKDVRMHRALTPGTDEVPIADDRSHPREQHPGAAGEATAPAPNSTEGTGKYRPGAFSTRKHQ